MCLFFMAIHFARLHKKNHFFLKHCERRWCFGSHWEVIRFDLWFFRSGRFTPPLGQCDCSPPALPVKLCCEADRWSLASTEVGHPKTRASVRNTNRQQFRIVCTQPKWVMITSSVFCFGSDGSVLSPAVPGGHWRPLSRNTLGQCQEVFNGGGKRLPNPPRAFKSPSQVAFSSLSASTQLDRQSRRNCCW